MRTAGGKLGLVLAVVVAFAVALLPASAHASSTVRAGRAARPAANSATGDRFTPLAPTRIYDGLQTTAKPTVDVPVTGTFGKVTVPTTATAVVVNMTGTGGSTGLYVEAYPRPASGSARPLASQLNLTKGQTAADLVTVPVGADHEIRLFHSGGSVTVLLDIAGYYSPSGADTYLSVTPHRAYDSGTNVLGQTPRLVSRALLGLPADATAVVVNLTAANPSASTFVSAWPGGAPRPTVSNLNLAKGETRANLATVQVSGQGISLFDAAGATRVIVDVEGWYDRSVTGSTFVPTGPTRVDAGTVLGANAFHDEKLESGANAIPSGASAALFTLTTTKASTTTLEKAYPTPTGSSDTPPTVSNLNLAAGATDANLVNVALGAGGEVRIRNAAGSATDIVDLLGYFVPAAPGNDVSAHQCSGSSFPSPPDSTFGIINPTAGDLAFSGVNPCLTAEEQWAAGTGDEGFYLSLSDKGPSSANWPTDNNCPKQNTAACSKEFGENQAQNVYADAGSAAGSARWWLDVEVTPTWQTTSGSAAGAALDAQVVLGAVTYLQSQGVTVGVYSNSSQWPEIVGTSVNFSTLPEWFTYGGVSDQQLLLDCGTPFAGGDVTQVQDIGTGSALDHDLRC